MIRVNSFKLSLSLIVIDPKYILFEKICFAKQFKFTFLLLLPHLKEVSSVKMTKVYNNQSGPQNTSHFFLDYASSLASFVAFD